jgi:hypothetical protein
VDFVRASAKPTGSGSVAGLSKLDANRQVERIYEIELLLALMVAVAAKAAQPRPDAGAIAVLWLGDELVGSRVRTGEAAQMAPLIL